MEFGIFSNSRRPARTNGEAWDEDIFEVVTADRLGFRVAWISEHQSPAELIICKAAGQTQQIRLGSAVRPLAYYHPLQIAIEANACDHLTGGRYQLGVGFGFYRSNMEQRGLDFDKTREMMHASIELIHKLWTSDKPVDYDGPFWTGKGMVVKPGPVQKPHPPMGIACSKTDGTPELAGPPRPHALDRRLHSVGAAEAVRRALCRGRARRGTQAEPQRASCDARHLCRRDRQGGARRHARIL